MPPVATSDLGTNTKPTRLRSDLESVFLAVSIAWTVLAVFLITRHIFIGADYVGVDNDDVMRLVQVRDLLAGQAWYDLNQYRLGLEGGTLMHWSRLIDLPIANLIVLFSMFTTSTNAEVIALTAWPLLTLLPLLFGFALGARFLATVEHRKQAIAVTLLMAGLYVVAISRFQPGAIDHHNLQMALSILVVALLFDPQARASAYFTAGIGTGLAIAVGVETTPLMAIVCLIVVGQWFLNPILMQKAAKAFGLSLATTLAVVFYATVPTAQYQVVACDAMSTGFYALGTFGGAALFLMASLASTGSMSQRAAAILASGGLVGGATLLIAPHCLANPLADLDPMLVTMWLNSVSEAQSIFGMLRKDPYTFGGFYAPPFLAIIYCVWKIARRENLARNVPMLALVGTAYAIAAFQVRGAVFANMFSILPLSMMILDLRRSYLSDQKNLVRALTFVFGSLAAIPTVWASGGATLNNLIGDRSSQSVSTGNTGSVEQELKCTNANLMAPLAKEPKGIVLSVSNLGASVLRYSDHHAISAPYHRNQGGMLTSLHVGIANTKDAEAFLRGAGVTLLAHCTNDPETINAINLAPAGLFGALGRSEIPNYLELVPETADTLLQLYRVRN